MRVCRSIAAEERRRRVNTNSYADTYALLRSIIHQYLPVERGRASTRAGYATGNVCKRHSRRRRTIRWNCYA